MTKKIISLATALIFISANFILPAPVFAKSPTAEYLCEFGISFYRTGQYDDALMEFNKALMLDPGNKTAKKYIDIIFKKDFPAAPKESKVAAPKQSKPVAQTNFNQQPVKSQGKKITAQLVQKARAKPVKEKPSLQKPTEKPIAKQSVKQLRKEPVEKQKEPVKKSEKAPSRDELMEKKLAELDKKIIRRDSKKEIQKEKVPQKNGPGLKLAGIDISGEVQTRLGVSADDGALWKRANFDLNEKNWRTISGEGLNRRENTYDPRIYDRLRVNLDKSNESGFNFHSNFTVDPWSFTGTSGDNMITIPNTGGDVGQIKLKYSASNGYTLNERVFTLQNGDSFNLPELKVKHGQTSAVRVRSAFGNDFDIPAIKMYFQFQPVRELWLDYANDYSSVRIFPFAYEKQAQTFDDPLKLSNNHTWWENSPWINSWSHGVLNSGAAPVDYSKGYWDNEISFPVRDSEGTRLTLLRGLNANFSPQEQTLLNASIATPKDPWQDYGQLDNIVSALRLKHSLADNLTLGVSGTSRLGFNIDRDMRLDANNYVLATDLGFEVINGLKMSLELAHAQSDYDLSNADYETDADGYAYYFSLVGTLPNRKSIMDTKYGYDGIQPEKGDKFFTKFRFFVSRMDNEFDAPLSSYVETRDDEYWSRHLHFRQPFQYYYQDGGLTWDDVKPFAIGNGIDIGRSTIGLRLETSLWDKKIENLFDIRNVHSTKGKFLENVSRDELTWQLNNKLTAKLLGIYQAMPDTTAGLDPFIFNPVNRVYYDNVQIEADKDPSLKTGSLGLEYKFFEWLALSGIWEYTNDISLGYDNFPRGLLNSGNNSLVYTQDGRRYRDIRNWLYSQQFFPKPPYPYYNIFKTGLRISPVEKMELYLSYTRNEYAKAGQVDDNMNHVGFEFSYMLTKKVGFFLKYAYSRWQDLDSLITGSTKSVGHHNFFSEISYKKSADEDFTFQYGEASRDPYAGGTIDIGWDPYGGSLRTIDTPHIVRLYYRRKF
ncbi:hypothetical protein D4Q80_04365 [bacterium]|nr:MAG: hypothetical protein D4Q80_04365 [bacterium]